MTEQTGHTKTPWNTYKAGNFTMIEASELNNNEFNDIAQVDIETNAHFIVTACNAYEGNMERIRTLTEALEQCVFILNTYVNGDNPNSPYKDGKHSCYVLGAKETLDKAKQALSNKEE